MSEPTPIPKPSPSRRDIMRARIAGRLAQRDARKDLATIQMTPEARAAVEEWIANLANLAPGEMPPPYLTFPNPTTAAEHRAARKQARTDKAWERMLRRQQRRDARETRKILADHDRELRDIAAQTAAAEVSVHADPGTRSRRRF